MITVFGIATAVITAFFLTFERNQRLKSAASMLKNDIRLIQNKALAGDKSSPKCSIVTNPAPVLIGWYLNVVRESIEYTINSDCRNSAGDEDPDLPVVKTVSLPRGVNISSISLGTNVNILYQPLTNTATFHNGSVTPSFFDASGNLLSQIGAGSELTITLGLESDPSKTYKVVIQPSGEVNEQK